LHPPPQQRLIAANSSFGRYCITAAEIARTEMRFVRVTETFFYIQEREGALIRQQVEQAIDILNDALGQMNTLARLVQISIVAFAHVRRPFISFVAFGGRSGQHVAASSKIG
jgi:hypothetical protein